MDVSRIKSLYLLDGKEIEAAKETIMPVLCEHDAIFIYADGLDKIKVLSCKNNTVSEIEYEEDTGFTFYVDDIQIISLYYGEFDYEHKNNTTIPWTFQIQKPLNINQIRINLFDNGELSSQGIILYRG